MKIKTFALALAVSAATTCTANAAPIYEIKDGKLMAIRGIYGGPALAGSFTDSPSYGTNPKGQMVEYLSDIEFLDGTCAAIFNECTGISSFSAIGASITTPLRSLFKDGVMVGEKTYNFASDPALVNGCESSTSCTITAGVGRPYGSVIASNFTINAVGGETVNGFTKGDVTVDTSKSISATFGRYTTYGLLVPTIPEPATWTMLLIGFGFIGAATRYRRKGVKVRYA